MEKKNTPHCKILKVRLLWICFWIDLYAISIKTLRDPRFECNQRAFSPLLPHQFSNNKTWLGPKFMVFLFWMSDMNGMEEHTLNWHIPSTNLFDLFWMLDKSREIMSVRNAGGKWLINTVLKEVCQKDIQYVIKITGVWVFIACKIPFSIHFLTTF